MENHRPTVENVMFYQNYRVVALSLSSHGRSRAHVHMTCCMFSKNTHMNASKHTHVFRALEQSQNTHQTDQVVLLRQLLWEHWTLKSPPDLEFYFYRSFCLNVRHVEHMSVLILNSRSLGTKRENLTWNCGSTRVQVQVQVLS